MPSLKDLHEKEERLKKRLAEKQSIGLSQAFEYGERSSAEYVSLRGISLSCYSLKH